MVIQCTNCGGIGNMQDGGGILDRNGWRQTSESTVCPICNGAKAIFVRPATPEEIEACKMAAQIVDAFAVRW